MYLLNVIYVVYLIIRHLIIYLFACSIILNWIFTTRFTVLIHFNDSMSCILIVKRSEHIMDLALYKINILLLINSPLTHSLLHPPVHPFIHSSMRRGSVVVARPPGTPAVRVRFPHQGCSLPIRCKTWLFYEIESVRETAMFWLWVDSDRPRHGHVAAIMRKTRASYHYAVRHIKRKSKMAESVSTNKQRDIWVETKKTIDQLS